MNIKTGKIIPSKRYCVNHLNSSKREAVEVCLKYMNRLTCTFNQMKSSIPPWLNQLFRGNIFMTARVGATLLHSWPSANIDLGKYARVFKRLWNIRVSFALRMQTSANRTLGVCVCVRVRSMPRVLSTVKPQFGWIGVRHTSRKQLHSTGCNIVGILVRRRDYRRFKSFRLAPD